MLKEITSNLIEAITQNGPISVFWGAVIEQVISPIPSVLIPLSAGMILISTDLPLGIMILQIIKKISFAYALGASLGASVLYFTAYLGGRALIEKFGKFFGLSLSHIDRFRNRFSRGIKDELLILLLVILPVTPISLVAASCGIIGVSPLEFYPLLFIGTFFRALLLGWLGAKAGETYHLLGSSLNKVESLISFAGVAFIFGLLAFLYYKRRKILKE